MSVMPAINFANPQLFGQVFPRMLQGMQEGQQFAGEQQRQAQVRAMAPLQLQHAQNVAAMDPLELQEAKNKAAISGMPQPIASGQTSRPVSVRRDTGDVITPDDEVPAGVPIDVVSQDTIPVFDPKTNNISSTTRMGKVLESDEERQTRESKSQHALEMSQAALDTANAKNEANRVREENAQLRKVLLDAQANKANAEAAAVTQGKPQTRPIQQPDGTWHTVQFDSKGNQIADLGVGPTPAGNKESYLEKAEKAAAADLAAKNGKPVAPKVAAPVLTTPSPTVGVKIGGPVTTESDPPSNPDKDTYDALPIGTPYLWNGVLHHKGQ